MDSNYAQASLAAGTAAPSDGWDSVRADQSALGAPVAAERVFIGLGTNLGDLAGNLRCALELIGKLPGTRVVAASPFAASAPWGEPDQPGFLNSVAEIQTLLPPEELLGALKGIEHRMGRVPSYRWGPRLIDLDILLYGERRINSATLSVPHPHILARPFVADPLRQMAPEVMRIAAGPLESAD